MHSSKSSSKLESSQRSTAESEKEKCSKKIEIIEVKDLKKKNNIQITSIKNIPNSQDPLNVSAFLGKQ